MVRVLIVEDEVHTRKGMIVTTPWESLGCEVVGEAKNGLEGLEAIKNLRPDLVITDVRMPQLTGIEMIQLYRTYEQDVLKADSHVNFMILSGFEDFRYAQSAIALGVKAYLLKPVNDQHFYEVIKGIAAGGYYPQSAKIKISAPTGQADQASDPLASVLSIYRTSQMTKKNNYVIQAVKAIEEHYYTDVNIGEVAEKLFITESYLSRLFKKETSYTFVDYLNRYRLLKALELMRDSSIKIYQIAELVGFKDARYFSHIVRKYLSMTPTELKGILLKNC